MKVATRLFGVGLGFLFLSAGLLSAQLTQPCSVADGSGARSEGGDWIHVSAGAQPGGIARSESGAVMNYSGFLGCAILRPDLDTDGDGLADEIDLDNDNDGLGDTLEMAGTAFGPATPTEINNPDSDSDGVTDGAEAGAQTNPSDGTHYLHFTQFIRSGGDDMEMNWVARENYLYKVYQIDLTNGLPGTFLTNVRAPLGGIGLWEVVTATHTAIGADLNQNYYIEVIGP